MCIRQRIPFKGGDYILTNSSIEQIANDAIRVLANKHPLLDPAINDHDKYMTYDGNISGFTKSGRDYRKRDWDFTVPIQVKGHVDKKNERKGKYISKDVELTDLHIYYSEHGVLYFEVLMDESGNNEEIFYAHLTQSKSKGYLDTAAKKKRKASIRVQFIKLPKTPDALYRILKQFALDSRKQSKQLADDTIKLKDIQNVQEITATVVDAKSEVDILRKIVEGEVCLFGKVPGNPYDIPIEWKKDAKIAIFNEAHKSISVGDVLYYDRYKAKETSDGEIFIYPSDNLELNLTGSRYHFDLKTDLNGMYTDAKFMLALLENTDITIAGHTITYTDPRMSDNLKERLRFIVDLYDTLDMIGFEKSIKIQELEEKSIRELEFLVNIRLGKYNDKLASEFNRYLWHFQGKCVPLLIIRNAEAQSNNVLADALYSRNYQPFASLKDREGVVFITPQFIYQSAETLANLYKYDYESFYYQIDKADINKYTIEPLNLEVLKLIKVYDICGDEHFLQIAEYLAKKLENVQHQEHYAMNRLQIKKRLGIWGEEERSELETMTNDTTPALFGKAVLLGDKEKAAYYFKKMSPEEKEQYSEYPIFTLYEQLT